MDWELAGYLWGENMGSNPASVDTANKIVYLNHDVWFGYTDFQQDFLIAHEEGH